MKKILMITAATIAFSSTTLAADAENMFYIKGALGGKYLQSATDQYNGVKLKSNFTPYLAVGPGYYVMDNFRTDLTLEYYFNPTMKKGTNKHKANIWGLMLNGYVDLFDVSVAKVFVGAGIGWAQVKEKLHWTNASGVHREKSVKKSNNFAWDVTLGANTLIADGVSAELSYSWKDFGKTSAKDATNAGAPANAKVGGTKYRGHLVTVGFRFDI